MKPAPSNIARWLSQVGSLTQTSLAGKKRWMNSAPMRRLPLEPIDWIVAMRPLVTASCPAPKSSCCTALRQLAVRSQQKFCT